MLNVEGAEGGEVIDGLYSEIFEECLTPEERSGNILTPL
jgi:hypothetical protein